MGFNLGFKGLKEKCSNQSNKYYYCARFETQTVTTCVK